MTRLFAVVLALAGASSVSGAETCFRGDVTPSAGVCKDQAQAFRGCAASLQAFNGILGMAKPKYEENTNSSTGCNGAGSVAQPNALDSVCAGLGVASKASTAAASCGFVCHGYGNCDTGTAHPPTPPSLAHLCAYAYRFPVCTAIPGNTRVMQARQRTPRADDDCPTGEDLLWQKPICCDVISRPTPPPPFRSVRFF